MNHEYYEYLARVQSAIDSGTLRCSFCQTRLSPVRKAVVTGLMWTWEDLVIAYGEYGQKKVEVQPDGLGYGFTCEECNRKSDAAAMRRLRKIYPRRGKLVPILSVDIDVQASLTRKGGRWRVKKVEVTMGEPKRVT
jgi:hypothetical protein